MNATTRTVIAVRALPIGCRSTLVRRHLTTALVAAAFASATATAASADPLGALFGSLFGQRPAQQYYQPAAVSAYAYAPQAIQPTSALRAYEMPAQMAAPTNPPIPPATTHLGNPNMPRLRWKCRSGDETQGHINPPLRRRKAKSGTRKALTNVKP